MPIEIISDFSLGQLSDRYSSKDIEIRRRAAETIEGFRLRKDGGLERRNGTLFVQDGLGITPATNRLYDANGWPSFVVYKYSGSRWVAYIQGTNFISKEIGGSGSVTASNAGLVAGVRLDATRFLDPETDTAYLHAWTPAFAFNVALATDALSEDTTIGPSVIYEGRQIGLERTSGIVLMSEALHYVDFVADETATTPLSLVGDFSGVEDLRWVKARQSVYMGTDQGEWEIYSGYPFFSEELGGLMARRISEIGTEQAEYFGPSLAMRDLSDVLVMSPSPSGGYQTATISERIDSGLLIQMCVNEYGTHRYLHALDSDGNLFTFVESPQQQMNGWVTLMTGIGWVASFGKDLYVGVERDGIYSVEVIPLDELIHPGDRNRIDSRMFRANNVYGDRGGYHVLDSGSLTGDTLPPSTLVDVHELDLDAKTSSLVGSTMTDANGVFSASLAEFKTFSGWSSGTKYFYTYQNGYETTGRIITLPISPIIGYQSTINRIVLRVQDSLAARVRVNDGAWESYSVTTPESTPWYFRPEVAHDDELRIEIQPSGYKPLSVYQVLVEYEAGDY